MSSPFWLSFVVLLAIINVQDESLTATNMHRTGLLIVSNLSRISNILKGASNHISQTLYISIADSALPLSPSDCLTRIYGQATKICNSLEVRVLIGNFKSKSEINPNRPIDLIMCDSPNIIGEYKDMASKTTLKDDLLLLKTSDDLNSDDVNGDVDFKIYDHVALGGTFDRLHNGHKILLSEGALRARKTLTVGVTDVNMIKSKKLWELIEPIDVRINNLKEFLADIDSSVHYNVVPIQDMYGPTKDDPNIQMLVVSQETMKGGDMVNQKRADNNLSRLDVFCIDLARESEQQSAEEEAKVSSSNRRMRLLGTMIREPIENKLIKPYPYVIGLTGGIASGKTHIAEDLKQLGAGIVNCDLLGHELYKPGTPLNGTIARTFGSDVIDSNGNVDRKKLGTIVFNDANRMNDLNDIMWPAILELARTRIDELAKAGFKVVVLEAAILIQANWDKYCHQVWTSIIPPEEALKRVMERNQLSETAAKSRIASQPSNSEQVARAHVVFSSLWSRDFTSSQVTRAWSGLLKYLDDKKLSHL